MKRYFDFHRLLHGAGFLLAVAFLVAAGGIFLFASKAYARDDLGVANYCSFVIPPEFVPAQEKGFFINQNHPMAVLILDQMSF